MKLNQITRLKQPPGQLVHLQPSIMLITLTPPYNISRSMYVDYYYLLLLVLIALLPTDCWLLPDHSSEKLHLLALTTTIHRCLLLLLTARHRHPLNCFCCWLLLLIADDRWRNKWGWIEGRKGGCAVAPFDGTKNSISKKVTFEYTHTYSSTNGDMSDLCTNGWRVDYKSSYS